MSQHHPWQSLTVCNMTLKQKKYTRLILQSDVDNRVVGNLFNFRKVLTFAGMTTGNWLIK